MTHNDQENSVFSNDTKYDFQTAHMINKIKNVKSNSKKKKKLLNIQNIEPLSNINEEPDESFNANPIIESFNANPIIEPLDVTPIIENTDWVEREDVYEGGGKHDKDIESFADLIERFFNMLSEWYDKIAVFITKTLSIDDFFRDDVKYVKKYISWFISIVVASFGLYNWLFVMFYKDKHGKRPDIWEVPRETIKKEGDTSPAYRLLNMITHIPLFFPYYLEKLIVKWIPKKVLCAVDDGGYKSAMIVLYISLLAVLTFVINHSYAFIKTTLISIASYNFEGVMSKMIYAGALILYIMSFMERHPLARILPIDSFIFMSNITNPIYWLEKVFIFIVLLFLGVPIATAMCMVYLVTFTLFGIVTFKGQNTVMEVKEQMDDFFNSYKPYEREDSKCAPLGFFDMFINYMIKIFNAMYDNCIQLGFIIVMVYAFIDSNMNVKSSTLKLAILICTFMVVAVIAMFSLFGKPVKTRLDTNIIDIIKTPIQPEYVKTKTTEFTDMLNREINR
jgi:hypothetical protein